MTRRLSFLCFTGLLLAGACSDDSSTDGNDDSRAELRDKVRAALAERDQATAGEAGGGSEEPDTVSGGAEPVDPCDTNELYGDGVCDWWCPSTDPADCTDDCPTAEVANKDGICDYTDACARFTDADCIDDGDDVACAAIWKEPDGVCDPNDPCGPYQDADCQDNGAPPDCPVSSACIEIAYATDGVCQAAPGCEYTDPVDCPCGGADDPDGNQGSTPGHDPDEPSDDVTDPDGVVCTAEFRPKDGVCPDKDPCDPDC